MLRGLSKVVAKAELGGVPSVVCMPSAGTKVASVAAPRKKARKAKVSRRLRASKAVKPGAISSVVGVEDIILGLKKIRSGMGLGRGDMAPGMDSKAFSILGNVRTFIEDPSAADASELADVLANIVI